jgi:hypothetical protein
MHLRLFKGFLLYNRRRCNYFSMTLDEHDVMNLIMKKPFENYMISAELCEDLAACESPLKPPPPNVSNVVTAKEGLTVQEFRRGTKRVKAHYEDLKDDKFFNTWNRGLIATACKHQTDLVLDEKYIPKTDAEKELFKRCKHLRMQC